MVGDGRLVGLVVAAVGGPGVLVPVARPVDGYALTGPTQGVVGRGEGGPRRGRPVVTRVVTVPERPGVGRRPLRRGPTVEAQVAVVTPPAEAAVVCRVRREGLGLGGLVVGEPRRRVRPPRRRPTVGVEVVGRRTEVPGVVGRRGPRPAIGRPVGRVAAAVEVGGCLGVSRERPRVKRPARWGVGRVAGGRLRDGRPVTVVGVGDVVRPVLRTRPRRPGQVVVGLVRRGAGQAAGPLGPGRRRVLVGNQNTDVGVHRRPDPLPCPPAPVARPGVHGPGTLPGPVPVVPVMVALPAHKTLPRRPAAPVTPTVLVPVVGAETVVRGPKGQMGVPVFRSRRGGAEVVTDGVPVPTTAVLGPVGALPGLPSEVGVVHLPVRGAEEKGRVNRRGPGVGSAPEVVPLEPRPPVLSHGRLSGPRVQVDVVDVPVVPLVVTDASTTLWAHTVPSLSAVDTGMVV